MVKRQEVTRILSSGGDKISSALLANLKEEKGHVAIVASNSIE
ncbi:MAG: hypothetical protein Ct9H300mP6_13320 [Gammaproteobacteria bacterium]|nr:MAG: hypothetical protein Ct9H300mP6_13320 [Gammaproteobacteria bacterium]